MSKRKTQSMGKAFAQMSRILNLCELRLQEMERNYRKKNYMPLPLVASDLGSAVEFVATHYDPLSDEILDFTEALVKGWGVDAANVRKSFKFRGKEGDLIHLAHTNPNRDHIDLRLPFPECTVVIDNPTFSASVDGTDETHNIEQMVLYIEGRVLDVPGLAFEGKAGEKDWYVDNGIMLGDEFISVVCGFQIEGMSNLFLIPAEFHFTANRPFEETNFTSGLPKGTPDALANGMKGYGRCVYMGLIIWLLALNSPQVKHDMRQGLKPGVIHTPRRTERVFYEHTILTIDPTKVVEQTDPLGSHCKHRLHPVRGHWRHYKSGKRSWIIPHWRGDKELGVVTHDYLIEPETDDA